ncbi:hypothetical protein PTKIN_Ptkin17bG0160400 [Pterospermum kingtungense]
MVSVARDPLLYDVYRPSDVDATHDPHLPPGLVIDLTISFSRTSIHFDRRTYSLIDAHTYNAGRENLCLDPKVLKTPDSFHRLLAPALIRLGILTTSLDTCNVINDITELGLKIGSVESNLGKRVPYMVELQETVTFYHQNYNPLEEGIDRALSESEIEFEANNYGMVAAKESSVKKMLNKVNVEVRDQDCMICLDELEVGLVASRMPCSHTFHDNCIKTWLKLSHYCPICRFEMPT